MQKIAPMLLRQVRPVLYFERRIPDPGLVLGDVLVVGCDRPSQLLRSLLAAVLVSRPLPHHARTEDQDTPAPAALHRLPATSPPTGESIPHLLRTLDTRTQTDTVKPASLESPQVRQPWLREGPRLRHSKQSLPGPDPTPTSRAVASLRPQSK